MSVLKNVFGCFDCWVVTQVITRRGFCSSVLWFLPKWLYFLCYLLPGITEQRYLIKPFQVLYSHVKFAFARFYKKNKLLKKKQQRRHFK